LNLRVAGIGAARAGFDIVNYWGDYNRADFWTLDEPGNQILVLRPR